MNNVIVIQRIPRATALTSVDPISRDLAHRIRTGQVDKASIAEWFENIGFAEWFERQGLSIYRGAVTGEGET